LSADKSNVPRTLLLADDSATIQRVIELTLADEDVKVVAVGDGERALAELETVCPDIVLVDVSLPGRNGYEVTQHIKQSPSLSHIPVVLLTGAFDPIDQARASEVGCDGVLAKPFEPQLVIERVRDLLAGSAPPAAAAGAAAPPPPAEPAETPAAEPVGAVPGDRTGPKLDDYFDRLDAAFGSLTGTTDAARGPESPRALAPVIDLPSSPPETPAPAAAASAVASAGPAPVGAGASAIASMPLPTLAEAFTALLAAEQDASARGAAVAWAPAAAAPAAPVSGAAVDEIARLVLERMSDRFVRETVGDVVSSVAERLVREEIERIKGRST
jgi:CheY-like chemotaxis protein